MPESRLKVIVWNTEWASPSSRRGKVIAEEIAAWDPDLVCLTEAHGALLPPHGHLIQPSDPPPYPRSNGGQKVILWSRWPWTESATVLPGGTSGRFVEGVTAPPGGRIRVTGVCIPWHDSHVRTGRRDRERWEDHEAYIDAMSERTPVGGDDLPEIVLGDFNQRLPRYWQPDSVYQRLLEALRGYEVVTSGWTEPREAHIDHVAVRGGLSGRVVRIWPKELDGLRLSDHVGIGVQVVSGARGG